MSAPRSSNAQRIADEGVRAVREALRAAKAQAGHHSPRPLPTRPPAPVRVIPIEEWTPSSVLDDILPGDEPPDDEDWRDR